MKKEIKKLIDVKDGTTGIIVSDIKGKLTVEKKYNSKEYLSLNQVLKDVGKDGDVYDITYGKGYYDVVKYKDGKEILKEKIFFVDKNNVRQSKVNQCPCKQSKGITPDITKL